MPIPSLQLSSSDNVGMGVGPLWLGMHPVEHVGHQQFICPFQHAFGGGAMSYEEAHGDA